MIGDFIYKYYVGPIINGESYTIVDTLTYAVILIIAVYLVYRWLHRSGIEIDQSFILSLIPYVVLGGLLRVVEDTGVVPFPWNILLITPVIFFVIFVYAVIALLFSRILFASGHIRDWHRGFATFGIGGSLVSGGILLAYGIIHSTIHPEVFAAILVMATISSFIVYQVLISVFHWSYVSDPLYRLLIFGHMLDASATSFGIDVIPLISPGVAYQEQHVVGSALIEATGTAFAMFPLKLAVIIPAIYILQLYRAEGNRELWHLMLLAMIMVGMAPGIRDCMRMVLYV